MFVIGNNEEFAIFLPCEEWNIYKRNHIPTEVEGCKGYHFVTLSSDERTGGLFISDDKNGFHFRFLYYSSITCELMNFSPVIVEDYFYVPSEIKSKELLKLELFISGFHKHNWTMQEFKERVEHAGVGVCYGVFNIKEIVEKASKLTDEDIRYRIKPRAKSSK